MSQKSIAQGKTEDGTVIELDLDDIYGHVDEKMKKYMDEVKEYYAKDKDKSGKGIVERLPSNAAKLIEQLQNISRSDITEQWTVAIPAVTTKEVAGHLRDYVFVTDVIKGQPGDTVNIPYVKDLDFEVLATVGNAFAGETTGLVNTYTTTLKEAGAWSDIAYGDIEKIDQNLLDELNRTFAHAAVRAEDKVLIELVSAETAANFAGQVDRKTGTQIFYAKNIPQAIGKLIAAGKEVHPGDCVLWINGKAYARLLEELVATEAFTYARGEVVQKGVLEDYLGVKIIVGGEVETEMRTTSATTGTCEMAYLFRAKRALALAPKRDILIETDRQIATRKLRLTASHTFGVKLLDAKECVRIWCNTKSGT